MTDKEILVKLSKVLQLDYEIKTDIWRYGFCGDGPQFEVAFKGESMVQLGSAKMTVQALELCAALKSLEILNVCYSEIDRFPEAACKLSNLKLLNLYGTKITELPNSIGELTSLEELEFGGTKIAELPDSICNLSQLKSLEAQHSELRRLPENIGKLINLEMLDIHHSRVNKLPDSLANCTKLSCLWWMFDEDNPQISEVVTANIMANFGTTSEMSSFARFRNDCHNNEFVVHVVTANHTLLQIWNDYERLLEVDDKTYIGFYGFYVDVKENGKRYLCYKKDGGSGWHQLNDNNYLTPAELGTWIFLLKHSCGGTDISKEEMESWIPLIHEFYCSDEDYDEGYQDFYDECKKKLDDMFKQQERGL